MAPTVVPSYSPRGAWPPSPPELLAARHQLAHGTGTTRVFVVSRVASLSDAIGCRGLLLRLQDIRRRLTERAL